MDRKEYLEKLARENGYNSVDDFVVACEMLHTSRKVGIALDSALMPDDLDKYLGAVDQQLYNSQFDK